MKVISYRQLTPGLEQAFCKAFGYDMRIVIHPDALNSDYRNFQSKTHRVLDALEAAGFVILHDTEVGLNDRDRNGYENTIHDLEVELKEVKAQLQEERAWYSD